MDYLAALITDPAAIVSGVTALVGIVSGVFALRSGGGTKTIEQEQLSSDHRTHDTDSDSAQVSDGPVSDYSDDDPLGLLAEETASKPKHTSEKHRIPAYRRIQA